MDPFSITCSTCKSRLKVRSAAAIGQVVSCPKCGGMVLVKLPDEVPPEVASAATKPVEQQGEKANPNNTKDFDDIESILTGSAPVPVAAASRGEQPKGVEKTAASLPEAYSSAAQDPPAKPQAAALLPAERKISDPLAPPAAPARRYGLWLALSVLMGIALAIAVVVAGSLLGRGPSVAKSQAQQVTATIVRQAENVPSPDNDPSPAQPQPKSADAAQTAEPPADAKAPPSPSDPQEKVQPPQDPLGFVDPAKSKAKPAPPLDIGEDPLGKFGQVLEGGKDDPLPVPQVAPVPESPVEEAPIAAAPAAPRPAPRTVDVAARLADPLPGIDVPGVPLADFLADLSGLSTIPITLDPEGLPLVGLSAATPVSLKAENTTIARALAEALAPLHLEYQVADDHVTVGLSSKIADRAVAVDDLTGKSEQRGDELAQWVTALVDPAVWNEGEDGPSVTPGAEQFAVRASDRTYAGTLLLLEKLRVARSMAVRSRQPAEVFRLESRSARARDALAAPISLNYSQPTLLVIVLDRLAKEGHVRILVDWKALAAEGWNADGEGILTIQNKPLSEALTELLAPMDLTWRAVDEQTVQVSTAAALDQALELELYPARTLAADAAAGNALAARLSSALSLEANSAGALRFDPVSGCILASLPQPKQQQLEKLLAEWGK